MVTQAVEVAVKAQKTLVEAVVAVCKTLEREAKGELALLYYV
jgi:hypothetical protein